MKTRKCIPAVPKITALLLAMMLLLTLLWAVLPHPVNPDLQRLRQQLAEDGCIIHAGGYVTLSDGAQVSYTNSLEALENCWRNGKRFCEIDLQETMDGTLICGHGEENELVFGTGLPTTASGADFLSCRIYGELTPQVSLPSEKAPAPPSPNCTLDSGSSGPPASKAACSHFRWNSTPARGSSEPKSEGSTPTSRALLAFLPSLLVPCH